MGLMDSIKDTMDVNRKFQLGADIPIEELYEKIKPAMPEAVFGPIELKKGLGGKYISFKGCDRAKVTLSSKKGVAVLKRVTDTESHATVRVMGVGMRVDGKNPVDIVSNSNAYWKAVIEALESIL